MTRTFHKATNIGIEISSKPANQRIQLATDNQSSSANGQSKIPKPDPKQDMPASVSTSVDHGLNFFKTYINPNLHSAKESNPLLSESPAQGIDLLLSTYQEIKPAQAIKINSDLRSSESHPLLSLYQEITPVQGIKINPDPQPQSHPLLTLYQEISAISNKEDGRD